MIDWRTLKKWEGDWLEFSGKAIERRRELLRSLLHLNPWLLTFAIDHVRTGREKLIHDFAFGFKDQLDLDSSVATTYDLERLLALAQLHESNAKPEPHRWFDALSVFDQTVAIAMLECEDPTEAVGRDLDRLIAFLAERIFTSGFASREFYVYHDPASQHVVGPEDVGIDRHLSHRADGRTRRLMRLSCRCTKDGKTVFLSHRDKKTFSVWIKIQRQIEQRSVENPYVIHDRCGLMFVVEQCGQIAELAGRIILELLRDGGEIVESLDGNHDKDATVDAKNDVSSSSYKVAKMLVRWHGRIFELQFTTFHDYFNASHSLTDANHALYKLRQARRYIFPRLWPQSVYGVHWDSGHVNKQMFSWMSAKLGWRVNEQCMASPP